MNEITITAEGLLWILGAIITIGGASAVISRWAAPFRTLKASVELKVDKKEFDSLKEELATLKGYQKGDHRELEKLEEGNEKICKCILAITDHELTGNSVDKLREAKNEMQDYLIKK